MIARKFSACLLVMVLTASAFAFASFGARSEQSSADTYGYYWTDSNAPTPSVAFNWIEISGSGDDVGFNYADSNYGGPYPIGFDFEFYGSTYSAFNVSCNGYIQFDMSSSDSYNDPVPSTSDPDNIIAPFWDDLIVYYPSYNYGAVFYETIGAAPNQQLVVEFFEVSRDYSYNLLTFEVILNETGEIWFQYLDMGTETGPSATAGIENSDGTMGCEYSYGYATLWDGLAVKFERGLVGFGSDTTTMVDWGTSAVYGLYVTNAQTFTDSFDITVDYSYLGWTVTLYDSSWNPLVDNNANMIPDTGGLAPDESFEMLVYVTVPNPPTEQNETTVLRATSFNDALVYDDVTLTTQAYQAHFGTTHNSYVEDTDLDGDFDYLYINASVDAVAGGYLGMYAFMYDASANYIGYTWVDAAVPAGAGTLNASFSGEDIYSSLGDGPYDISLELYDNYWNYIDYSSHTAAALAYTDFDPPMAMFFPPFSDYALDDDLNGLYDYLVVNVTIEIFDPGYYTVTSDMYDDWSWTYLGEYDYSGVFAAGVYEVQLLYPSPPISQSSLDGPCYLYLDLYYDNSTWVDYDNHLTESYLYSDFEGPPALFLAPYSDNAYDSDSDGYYNQINVTLYIECFETGLYDLEVWVYDMSWNEYAVIYETVSLTAGMTVSYTVVVDGAYIYSSGDTGDLYLDMYLYENGATSELDYDYYYTDYYYYWDFDVAGALIDSFYDFGRDTDADGLYNELVFTVYVDPLSTGDFLLMADLYDYYYGWIMDVSEVVHLTEGVLYAWEVVLTADEVLAYGSSGYFEIDAYIYDETYTFYYDYGYDITSYYDDSVFDQVGAFIDSFYDFGRDTDSDGWYNELVFTVYIDPLSTGDFLLEADVYDYYYGWIMDASEVVSLVEGVTYEWEVVLSSYDLLTFGSSGYFEIDAYVYDETGMTLYDSGYDYSSYYYMSDFDPIGAFLEMPYDDYGRDDDSDGYYDYLVMSFYVNASTSGYYDIEVYVEDPWGYSFDTYMFELYLDDGIPMLLEVEIPASAIWDIGYDGWWYFEMTVYDHYSYTEYDWDYYYTTDSYSYTDFDPPAVQFDPPHADYGLDTDSDYYYDYLMVDVELNCGEAGAYTVYADLYTPGWSYLTSLESTESMTVGNEVVEFAFEGWILYNTYSSGNFIVELVVEDDEGNVMDYDTHWTSYYYYWDFEYPPAEFSSPHSDYAVDEDDDSLYDYLIVNASVEAYADGDYAVRGILYDEWDNVVDLAVAQATLAVGVQDVQLWFDAFAVANADYYPSYVELALYDDQRNEMDTDWHYLDGTYDPADFDPSVPMIEAGWAYDAPVIDGTVSLAEWFGADPVDLLAADGMNEVAGTIYILNNGTHLFVLIDATGDLTETDGDFAAVAFDTGNDEVWSDMHEDMFTLEASSAGTYTSHSVFDSWYGDWTVDCEPFDPLLTDHEGLAGAAGFGASEYSATAHRVYELCIPLALLMVSPGEDIGFAGLPAVVDGDDGAYSTWPIYFAYYPSLALYGDLLLTEEPPLTTVELSGDEGEEDWFVSEVEATLTATGGTGGVADTFYRIDGAAWQTYDDPFVIDDEGSHTVQYYSVDTAGNEEPTRTVMVMVDTVAPDTSASVDGTVGEDDWITSAATVEFTVVDVSSGLSVIMYSLDEGDWTELSGTTLVISEDGAHTLEFYSVDVAGLEEAVSTVEFSVDMNAPVTTAAVDGSTVTLTVLEEGSGVSATMYRVDGGDWVVYDGEFEVQGAGNHTVEYYSVDVAGNNETVKVVEVEGKVAGLLGVDTWVWVVIIAAIVAAVLLVLFMVMRRRPQQPQNMYPGQPVVEQDAAYEPPPPPQA